MNEREKLAIKQIIHDTALALDRVVYQSEEDAIENDAVDHIMAIVGQREKRMREALEYIANCSCNCSLCEEFKGIAREALKGGASE